MNKRRDENEIIKKLIEVIKEYYSKEAFLIRFGTIDAPPSLNAMWNSTEVNAVCYMNMDRMYQKYCNGGFDGHELLLGIGALLDAFIREFEMFGRNYLMGKENIYERS